MYKKVNDEFGVETDTILRTTDNVFIPKQESNVDYQEYLKWVSEGNTIAEAD